MSFSSEQKKDIILQPIKNACCRRAFLEGVMAARAVVVDETITLSVHGAQTAAFLGQMIRDNYSKEPTITTSSSGGRCRIVAFEAKSALAYLSSFYSEELFYIEKCPVCQSAFLRGVFLAAGRVSDPTKQYSLEFSLKGATDRFCDFFKEIGMTPRVSRKPNEVVIYFKNSAEIEDYFALANMNQTTFAFMNAKIQAEIRNNANRIANCETNNIVKAVSSSMEQVKIIEELASRGLLSQLPEELEKTARLRMEHRDLSLSQLAALITPKVTKPGLSHRLKRIVEIAGTLLGEGKKK